MDILELDAICLKAIDFQDNDKLITLYGTGKGKILVTARGCKKPKAKLKFAASPLCFGHYYLSVKSGRYTLTGCDLYDSFFNLAMDPVKYYSAAVILELMDKMGMEEDYNNNLFIVGLKCLKELCYITENPKETLFRYLKEIFSTLGYQCNAITFIEYYNYIYRNFDIQINSLKEITKI